MDNATIFVSVFLVLFQLIITIIMVMISKNQKQTKDDIKEIKDYVKAELSLKQDVKTCELFHDGHSREHAFEERMSTAITGEISKDLNGLGKKLESHMKESRI